MSISRRDAPFWGELSAHGSVKSRAEAGVSGPLDPPGEKPPQLYRDSATISPTWLQGNSELYLVGDTRSLAV